MNTDFPSYFRHAISEASKSNLEVKVGACLVVGKSVLKGHNKMKTHPKFANPNKHVRTSLHAELDCFVGNDVGSLRMGGTMITYRVVNHLPAMSRPCEHCMKFLKERGVKTIIYSIAEEPYWKTEEI